MSESLILSHYQRWLWEAQNLLVISGKADKIIQGRGAYQTRHGVVSGQGEDELARLFAAASLAAVSLAERESWGWSLTLAQKPYGFFCAVEPEGLISGRVLKAPCESQAVTVQRQRRGGPLVESRFEAQCQDPAAAVQRYFEVSEQTRVRLSVGRDGEDILIHALPGGQIDELLALDEERFRDAVLEPLSKNVFKPLEEVLIFYECRCSEDVIARMVGNLSATDQKDVWGDQFRLEVECPRCGRCFVLCRE